MPTYTKGATSRMEKTCFMKFYSFSSDTNASLYTVNGMLSNVMKKRISIETADGPLKRHSITKCATLVRNNNHRYHVCISSNTILLYVTHATECSVDVRYVWVEHAGYVASNNGYATILHSQRSILH